jgi:hypothetical protein
MSQPRPGEQTPDNATHHPGWDAWVDAYAERVWARLGPSCGSTKEASELFQLVWLRLEQVTRDGDSPDDISSWIRLQLDEHLDRTT